MSFYESFVLALGLSMDAFAVALCKGLALSSVSCKSCLTVGAWFGVFQGVMPYLGFSFGNIFSDKLIGLDNIISFVLLILIGVNMLKEAQKEKSPESKSLSIKTMLISSLATSIDALTVGISMAFVKPDNYYFSFFIIAFITFLLSSVGLKIGSKFGTKYKTPAEITGGLTLILLGIKNLVAI